MNSTKPFLKSQDKMLTLQFLPYQEIESLPLLERIQKILEPVKHDRIILLEGKLQPEEEAQLIQQTMEAIAGRFKGIEFSYLNPHPDHEVLFQKIRDTLVHLLLGTREGFTVIGPAKLIQKIKKDPHQIQLATRK